MFKKILLFSCFISLTILLHAQTYTDYLGAGHQQNISIATSHQQSNANNGYATIDGFPILEKDPLIDAGRFLSQATLGADYTTIQQVAAMGYEEWINQQFTMPMSEYLPLTKSIYDTFINFWNNSFGENTVLEDGENLAFAHFFTFAWWQNNLTANDLLRHKIALALSEILVISYKAGPLEDSGFGAAYYYDILYKNAFGNYKDILREVTLSPAMGTYLSHFQNPKSDPSINRHPDENYAREVMQLFTIGLYELNQDGTQKLSNGQPIPTYNNTDIKEFAKIFTGLGGAEHWHALEDFSDIPVEWEDMYWEDINPMLPMKMFEEWHEPGQKILLNGQVVPAGQTGMQDIEAAITNLFQHDNIGPFISRRLIQHLVKSNPSPDYIERVAAAFKNDGNNVRGNMQAIIKAILLDPEARNCDPSMEIDNGKLRAPLARLVHGLRAFNANNPSGKLWNDNNYAELYLQQAPLRANSVFNFYLPDYQPNGAIANSGKFGPEFQIHNSTTSIAYGNMLFEIFMYDEVLPTIEPTTEAVGAYEFKEQDFVQLQLTTEQNLLPDLNALLDRLDIILTNGHLTPQTRSTIYNALSQMDVEEDAPEVLRHALFLLMLSPDYAILK